MNRTTIDPLIPLTFAELALAGIVVITMILSGKTANILAEQELEKSIAKHHKEETLTTRLELNIVRKEAEAKLAKATARGALVQQQLDSVLAEVGLAKQKMSEVRNKEAQVYHQLALLDAQLKEANQKLARRDDAETAVRKELLGLRGKLVNVAILFDSSGSMTEGGRWEQACQTVQEWIQYLPIKSCVLIVFSDNAAVYPKSGRFIFDGEVGATNRLQVRRVLQGTEPKGATNTLAALQEAYRREIDTIVVFTDGQPTLTNVLDKEMVREIYKLAESNNHRGIPINTVGVGNFFVADFAEFLLKLSEKTGGTFLGR